MEDILISIDPNGGTATLTTASPMSHYGIPVLRIEADDVEGDFGPADIIDGDMTAAGVILGWANRPGRTEDELRAARLYLGQWPEGPQLWGGPRPGAGRKPTGRGKKQIYVTDDEFSQVQDFIKKMRED